MVRGAGPNVACSTVTCGAVAAAVAISAWVGEGVAWAAMVPGTLTSQVRRMPAARAEPHPSLWRLHGPCEVALLVHECSAPQCTSVIAWGRLAARPLRRCRSGVQGGTRMMESDSWRDQCASSDLIGFSLLCQRVSLVQAQHLCAAEMAGPLREPATRRYRPGWQVTACSIAEKRPREQASWTCVSSGYTEVARQMFPGRGPILQWGLS